VENANKLAAEVGYVATPDEVHAENHEVLDAALKGSTPTT
jgi:hypothetical protein